MFLINGLIHFFFVLLQQSLINYHIGFEISLLAFPQGLTHTPSSCHWSSSVNGVASKSSVPQCYNYKDGLHSTGDMASVSDCFMKLLWEDLTSFKCQWPFPIPVGKPAGLVWLLWDMTNKHSGKDYSGIIMHQLEPRHRLHLLVKPQTIGKANKILIWLNSWLTQVYLETVKRQHDLKRKQVKRSRQPHDCNFENIYKFCYLGKKKKSCGPSEKEKTFSSRQGWVVAEHPHLQ